MATTLFLLLVAAGVTLFIYIEFFRDKLIRRRHFPKAWIDILEHNLPAYRALGVDEQQRLRELIHLFLAKKRFYGCAGLELTDEIRVTIAGQACLLLLGQGRAVYPKLQSVLVYPSAFRAQREQWSDAGTVHMEEHHLLGESWELGKVILSWDDVTRGVSDFTDGQNVVLHEFAHQLDGLSGTTNGAPPLYRNSYQSWARVFTENFEDLRSRGMHGHPTVLDTYGGTNPAEFFAVSTEAFFERPFALEARRPELFEELRRYYNVDPRDWHQPGQWQGSWPERCDTGPEKPDA